MKITEVICQILRIQTVEAKTAGTQDTLLIRVRTDTGLEGIGESDASPEILKAIIDAPFSHNIASGLRRLLLGLDPLEHDLIRENLYRATMYYGRRAVGIAAMAGIDMALWDIKGKFFKQPIHRLLGGKRHATIPAYASILFGRDGAQTKAIAERWRGRRRHRADRCRLRVGCAHRPEPRATFSRVQHRLARGAAFAGRRGWLRVAARSFARSDRRRRR
jgi:L-alanine-DL-glutamate epimerase-like enolase superfamily enzyme